ncbi:TetR family transcriptional regulator [Streptomyces sp. ASQP_92]|uniref:TetR family transcriptional regulator n=1 Tax=Streptomyces sp. ASQP_92 TaxID=2979116 RepID=UPI0021BFD076|nr:TetR family transcriptional regulator [Streptomyces sp. ASQP_92]MCT9092441.1 TetR family transcriptional regulator [Streptomyces sp. ASQP_92]
MATRVRRTPDEAKRQILEAAAKLLAAGGPAAVQVRAVAAEVGVSDAAVNHHFGTRERLLSALLRFGGTTLKSELHTALAGWTEGAADPAELVRVLAALYAGGFAELALALRQLGWRDTGSGLLDEVVDRLHAQARANCATTARTAPTREAVQLAVAAAHQALATEPLFGDEFRRSVGLDADARDRMLAWWVETLRALVAG